MQSKAPFRSISLTTPVPGNSVLMMGISSVDEAEAVLLGPRTPPPLQQCCICLRYLNYSLQGATRGRKNHVCMSASELPSSPLPVK